jgi:GNAT superfamily N-acetyltransferase
MELTIRRAGIEEILALRHAELRPGLPRESADFDGDREPATRHFGAFLTGTGENVGCASFMLRPWAGEPAYQLRGMATRADVVCRGIGRALLGFADRELARETGVRLLWCNARTGAAPFYTRLGWAIVSDPFDVAGVGPHYRMLRR